MKVLPIKREHIYHVWDRVKDQVALALELGMMTDKPEFDVEYIHQKLLEGVWEIFVCLDSEGAIHGSGVVSYMAYPSHTVAHVVTMAGKGICSAKSLLQFKDLLQSRGVTKIQGYDRPSMVRLIKRFGLRPRYMLMELNL